jgi:hypothetical protein
MAHHYGDEVKKLSAIVYHARFKNRRKALPGPKKSTAVTATRRLA